MVAGSLTSSPPHITLQYTPVLLKLYVQYCILIYSTLYQVCVLNSQLAVCTHLIMYIYCKYLFLFFKNYSKLIVTFLVQHFSKLTLAITRLQHFFSVNKIRKTTTLYEKREREREKTVWKHNGVWDLKYESIDFNGWNPITPPALKVWWDIRNMLQK